MPFQFIKQSDAINSGPVCLKMVAGFYKVALPLSLLIRKCSITKEGISFAGLSEVADSIGFRTIGVKIPYDLLLEKVTLPCIVHWKQKHFIVVYKIKNKRIWAADPAIGIVKYSREEFNRSWAFTFTDGKPEGLVLIIEPTPAVYENDDSEAEQIYDSFNNSEKVRYSIVSINDEIKRYLATHPEKVYNLNSRNFEELIADILHDFGFDVELTKATRDGGVDIYAYVRTEVCNFLVFVECKKWAPDHHVGLDIVQRLFGVQQSGQANKSMIITTSFFTGPAIKEVKRYNGMMELRDYNALKAWLGRYKDFDPIKGI
jgi:hypothetical protein